MEDETNHYSPEERMCGDGCGPPRPFSVSHRLHCIRPTTAWTAPVWELAENVSHVSIRDGQVCSP